MRFSLIGIFAFSLLVPGSILTSFGTSIDGSLIECPDTYEGNPLEVVKYPYSKISEINSSHLRLSCYYNNSQYVHEDGDAWPDRFTFILDYYVGNIVNDDPVFCSGEKDNVLQKYYSSQIYAEIKIKDIHNFDNPDVTLDWAIDNILTPLENLNIAANCPGATSVEDEDNPFEDAIISYVSTRGHTQEFVFDNPIVVKGQSTTSYDTSGNIPGFEEGKCPSETVIYIHGFDNTHADSLVNLDDTQLSLILNNYDIPIIGFSWDSDTGTFDFTDAGLIAKLNGPKLASFIKDYKNSCSDTTLRLMSHSLGAQVVMSTLESLHNDAKWNSCGYSDDKITSVHVLGAAIPNSSVSKHSKWYGNAIESEVGIFHNKFNNEDNILSTAYAIAGSGQALGEEGAASVANKPSNYHQQDVTREVGNDHSGYNKVSSAYNSNDPEADGVIDDVVRDWRNQNYSSHPSCSSVDLDDSIGGIGDSIGGIGDSIGGIGDSIGGIGDSIGGIGDIISGIGEDQVNEISEIAESIPLEDIEEQANEIIKQLPSSGGGCLIATATYGSELAPQVQQLRELRDNSLLNTESGTAFMNTFNDVYYYFSPTIADYERENPIFQEMVKIAITPMISSLSILNYVNMDSEESVLGYGISMIILNLGMYIGIPAIVIVGIRKKF